MTRIAHLTDLHFGATDPAVVRGLLDWLNANPPDLLAVSGDLTQGARRSEFRAARAFLDAIAAPALVVPGNHDITPYKLLERFFDPYLRWRQEIALQTQPVWQDTTIGVVGLNTARRAGLTLDWSRGRVTASRLRTALRALDALPAPLIRIVVAHHPLLPPEPVPGATAQPAAPPVVVGGAARALAAFAAHQVRLVLAGHLHVSYTRLHAPQAGGPLILQGGSATSTRLRGEPNAFNLIDIAPDGTAHIDSMRWDPATRPTGAWHVAASHVINLGRPPHAL